MDETKTKPNEFDSEMSVLTTNISCFHQIQAKWYPFVWSLQTVYVVALFRCWHGVKGLLKVLKELVTMAQGIPFYLALSLLMTQGMYCLSLINLSLWKLCPRVQASRKWAYTCLTEPNQKKKSCNPNLLSHQGSILCPRDGTWLINSNSKIAQSWLM